MSARVGWALMGLLLASPSLRADPPTEAPRNRREGKAVIPSAASEGPRDLTALPSPLQTFVKAQAFGKEWKDLVHTTPAPKDRTGLAEAKTHPALKHDPIEMQAQAQFLEETGTEVRYGWISVRAVRAYRYGKLAAVQLVLDRLGREERPEAQRDLDALAAAWKDPLSALGLTGFAIKRNDLAERAAGRAAPLPLRIVIEPARGASR